MRRVGEPPESRFEPQDHLELGRIDMERGARSPARASPTAWRSSPSPSWLSTATRSTRSSAKGSCPVLPPVLVREEAMYGTGFLPTDEVNIYSIERDELYLTGTSEVGARRAPHGRDPRRGGAAAALRGLLDVLPARGRSGRQGHARHVPRPPVRQGRDVRLLRARARHATSTSGCSRSRRSSSRISASRTAS